MADLVAHKRVTYAGRVYRPGVAFSASPVHARLLVARGMAGFARDRTPQSLQVADCRQTGQSLDELRAAYTAKTGKSPNKRWGVPRLTKEMAL